MRQTTVDVIIPSYRPDAGFRGLLRKLSDQSVRVSHILVINTDEQYWDEELIRGLPEAEVFHITREEFDHAGTRNMGAGFSDADYIVFLTQDAMPADRDLIRNLLGPFRDPVVKAVYGRQLPKKDCKIAEGFVRSYNYPAESHVRTLDDLPEYGIKTFFCSNVCAAYDHRVFRELNGFSEPSIFNEDMIYAGRLMRLGYAVAYAADAEVYHSHNYSCMTQFHRNFDNGVSQAMHPELFADVPSEGEGKKMIRFVAKKLRSVHRSYLLPGFLIQCGFRLAGFRLGANYRKLPAKTVVRLSMNKTFWNRILHGGGEGAL